MPFYRHAKTAPPDPTTGGYDTHRAAKDGLPDSDTVTYVGTADELTAWHAREQDRLNGRRYQAAPALPHHEKVGSRTAYRPPGEIPSCWQTIVKQTAHHYLHLSEGNPSLVAYTPDDLFGAMDRQVRCKPGRYLRKFYGNVFTEEEIRKWADHVKASGLTMHMTDTPEECVRVYRAPSGPESCMQGKTWTADSHPAQVYGGGDVAVAYLGHISGPSVTNDVITARAVVNRTTKSYATVYGTASGELRVHLDAAGYTVDEKALEGARILACFRPVVDGERSCVMPYVDGMERAIPADGGFMRLTAEFRMTPGVWWASTSNLEGWSGLFPSDLA
jgi:hypothetical protein